MIISRKNFIKYIAKIKELREIEEAINKIGEKIEFVISFSEHEQLAVDILEDAFNDKECQWISYFCQELDFGSEWYKGCITMDGNDVPMSNAEELYEVLIDNINEKNI